MRLLPEPPALVLSSPWLRARETAQLLTEAAGLARFRSTRSLLPWAAPRELLDELASNEAAVVLCAGHAPHLDTLIAHLAGSSQDFTWLKKAGACAFDMSGPTPLLQFLAQPRTLRRLA